MLRPVRIVVLLAALVTAACVPETETFLSSPGAQPLDGRLVGTWYWLERDGREAVILTVRRGGDKRFSVVWTEIKPRRSHDAGEAPVQFVRYAGHTTRLGKASFINLTLVDRKAWKSGVPSGTIMRYWIGRQGLRIAFMKNDVIRSAVKEGRLAGRLLKDGVIVTAERNALIAFMRKTGLDKAFAKPTKPLRRLAATGS